jgi:hypothetical protein
VITFYWSSSALTFSQIFCLLGLIILSECFPSIRASGHVQEQDCQCCFHRFPPCCRERCIGRLWVLGHHFVSLLPSPFGLFPLLQNFPNACRLPCHEISVNLWNEMWGPFMVDCCFMYFLLIMGHICDWEVNFFIYAELLY